MSDIPLSNISGFGGYIPIGGLRFMPDVGGDFTDVDGSYYLRSGLGATAASYPTAATKEHIKISGVPNTYSGGAATQIADNGAGTIVVADASTTLKVSTDGGVTFSSVNPALSSLGTEAVVWNGSRFIAAAISSANMYCSYSTNGTSWTSGGTFALTGSSTVGVRGVWNGSVAFFVGGNVTNAACTTPDGVTVTQRTLPVEYGSSAPIANGSTIVYQAYTGALYTTTNGSSFTAKGSASGHMGIVGSTYIIFSISTNSYVTTTDLTTFATRSIPFAASVTGFTGMNFTADGTRGYFSCNASSGGLGANKLMYTTDGINWTQRFLGASCASNGSWFVHKGIIAVPYAVTSSKVLKMANFSTPDYVGFPTELFTSSSSNVIGYVRLTE
jgi:hypothetical protein